MLSALLQTLKTKGFTVFAVLDPSMHAPEQLGAVLGLFDGEINIYKSDDAINCRKYWRVKKLQNQDYVKNPYA